MTSKVYIETSVVIHASVGFNIKGKSLKSRRYDNAYNLLQYAEMNKDRNVDLFYTTQSVITEANRVLEKALNNVIQNGMKTLKIKKKGYEKELADRYFAILNECLDQMEYWLSFLKQETIDIRRKDEVVVQLQEEFMKLDMEFRKKCGSSWNDFKLYDVLNRKLRRAAKFVRTIQRREDLEEYKPNPGLKDMTIMAEIASINYGQNNQIYIVSEDRHFCSQKSRDMLSEKFGLVCRYCHEMLQDRLIRVLIEHTGSVTSDIQCNQE